MAVIEVKHRYQLSRIAQIGTTDVALLVNDGSGFGPAELGAAGWRAVSTFIGPGKTPHGVGQFVWALWERAED